MPDLLKVTRIDVPRDVVEAVQQHLREAGEASCEGVAFWAGELAGDHFSVRAALVPAQIRSRTEDGVSVLVTGEELFRMNVWLHKNKLMLVAQLHSHPSDAYHSETDDEYSIMTQAGGLSIVVPDFARAPFSLKSAAVYRLDAEGRWVELQEREASDLIKVLE